MAFFGMSAMGTDSARHESDGYTIHSGTEAHISSDREDSVEFLW